jgi:L-alanine-DL-glutamate epimerase-like enolase superfamily enzyme
MVITDIRTHVVRPIEPLIWVLVEVETDEGLSGLGDCTEYIGNAHLVRGLQAIRPYVIGADARHIEEIWQRLFHSYSNLNGRSYISHLISAIDPKR